MLINPRFARCLIINLGPGGTQAYTIAVRDAHPFRSSHALLTKRAAEPNPDQTCPARTPHAKTSRRPPVFNDEVAGEVRMARKEAGRRSPAGLAGGDW